MTIESAAEFVRLRESEVRAEYERAAHDDAPEEVWFQVLADRPDMRFWVAQNKTVPLSVLRVLATDGDDRVRSMVARKRKLDRGLFEVLAADRDDGVRCSVARNAKVPEDILATLAADEEAFVRAVAKEKLHNR